jgi:hypothetical protein
MGQAFDFEKKQGASGVRQAAAPGQPTRQPLIRCPAFEIVRIVFPLTAPMAG